MKDVTLVLEIDPKQHPKIRDCDSTVMDEICDEFEVEIRFRRKEEGVTITIVGCKGNAEAARREIQRILAKPVAVSKTI